MKNTFAGEEPALLNDVVIGRGFIDDIAHSFRGSIHSHRQSFLTTLQNQVLHFICLVLELY